MDRDLKLQVFQGNQESPGSWYLQALRLRAVAARLDWKVHPPNDDEPAVSFVAEYQMMLGLAFENLLKGLISLVRLESRLQPALPRECRIHKLELLAARSECREFAISDDEIETLTRLSPYIEWAGRYPVPKSIEAMMIVYAGSRERMAEHALWDRLASILRDRGWVMKGGPESLGGHRLYLTRHV